MKQINKLFAAALVALLLISGGAYASFPVKNETKKEQTSKSDSKSEINALSIDQSQVAATTKVESADPVAANGLDEKWVLVLLWFFLGGFAAHRWYKKKPVGWNILYILTAGGCGIWAIVDLINILTDNF
ncbi:MAG: TM2 domain-containing protein [Bacteroidia bacterium]